MKTNRRQFFSLTVGALVGAFLPKPKTRPGYKMIAAFDPAYGADQTAGVWVWTSPQCFTMDGNHSPIYKAITISKWGNA